MYNIVVAYFIDCKIYINTNNPAVIGLRKANGSIEFDEWPGCRELMKSTNKQPQALHKINLFIIYKLILFVCILLSISIPLNAANYPADLIAYWSFDENDGTIAIDAVNSRNGTIYGAARNSGKVGKALSFGGLNYDNRVEAQKFGDIQEGTIEAWVLYNKIVNPPVNWSSNKNSVIVFGGNFGDNGDTGCELGLVSGDCTHTMSFGIWYNSGWRFANSGISPEVNKWYHIAGTWGPEGVKFYVNGELKGTYADYKGGMPSYSRVLMGSNSCRDNWMAKRHNGSLDEVAVYKRALTSQELLEHYNNGLQGKGYFEQPVPQDTNPPTVPQLTAPANNSASSDTSVTFDWSDSTDDDSGLAYYEIQISNDQSFNTLYYSAPAWASQLSLTLSSGKSYYWRVRARDNKGNVSNWSTSWKTSLLTVYPLDPVNNLAAEALDGARIKLSWESPVSSFTARYNVYYSVEGSDIDYAYPKGAVDYPGETWTSPALIPGKAYHFVVRAMNIYGMEEKNTNIVSVKTVMKIEGIVKAKIKTPKDGKKISGNRMMIMAELASGKESDTGQILFEYKKEIDNAWTTVPAANRNNPNPDTSSPYFTHLDVNALEAGRYNLRASATDIYGATDKNPEYITVIVDHHDPDVCEGTNSKGEQEKKERIDTSKDNTIQTTDCDKGKTTQVVLLRDSIDAANTKVSVVLDPIITVAPPDRINNLCEFREITLENATLTGEAAIVITYKDDDDDGNIDGTDVPVNTLRVFAYNSKTSCWEKLPTEIDKKNKTAKGRTTHFSLFALFGAPATDFNAVRLYPNPFKPSKGHTYIKLDNLTVNTRVQVFTLAGDMVYDKEDIDSGEFIWNAANQAGSEVASGVYICVITNDLGEKKILKLAVIR